MAMVRWVARRSGYDGQVWWLGWHWQVWRGGQVGEGHVRPYRVGRLVGREGYALCHVHAHGGTAARARAAGSACQEHEEWPLACVRPARCGSLLARARVANAVAVLGDVAQVCSTHGGGQRCGARGANAKAG